MTDKSSSVEPRSTIKDIAPYVPGRDKAPDGVKLFKLSSNETPLGPSPKAVEAFRDEADALAVYPDGSAGILRQAIAEAHGLNANRILCGNGSDELLGLLCQAYIRPGDEAIFTEHGFLIYRIQTLAAGGTPIAVPENHLHADVDAILGAVTDRTRLVFLANPNNPTGTYLRQEEVRRLRENLPSNVLLVLDAAYAEYVRRNDYEAGIEIVADHDNVVMTRTFSKIYGLAALRIGWLFGPPSVIDTLNRIRGPFNVNSAAIAAGVAAMKDRQHRAKAVSHNDEWLPWLTRSLTELGLTVTPSVGNFLLVHFPDRSGKSATDADAFLVQRGYILRQMAAYGLPDALRLTVGTSEANEGVVEALRAFLHG